MNGYLASKNGKYYAVISYRDKTGKMKSKWISSGMDIKGNKKSAQAFLADQMAELEKELADEKAGFKPKYDVTLRNNGIDAAASSLLTAEQQEMYAIYNETKGNREDLF